jgi:RNA polymerase sigma-70 factor (ECF subfamily)
MDNQIKTALPHNGDEAVFEQLFKTHFRQLHAYAYTLLKDWDIAEEIVQGLFLQLWESSKWQGVAAVKSYLYKSVYYDSLNYLRRQKVAVKYENFTANAMKNETDDAAGKLNLSELERHLDTALHKLPDKCREVFQLSRFEELKYKEIADHLGISVKTVETHMSKALRILRTELKEFLPLFIVMLLNMFRS